jgi:histidinol phosphatase-like enzyme
MDKNIYYVDIDGTICIWDMSGEYEKAEPFMDRIEKMNKLYDEGHTIVYWTARGTQTGIDWYDVTKKQFDDWGVKYHELRMKKPHYNVFIDDKAFNSEDFFA